jgi:glycine/D-amino acid oxidase-like deaminating enzyme
MARDGVPPPAAIAWWADGRVCTTSPVAGLVIDNHSNSDRVVPLSVWPSRGFKHSAAIGERVAGMVSDRQSRFDVSGFSAIRPGGHVTIHA